MSKNIPRLFAKIVAFTMLATAATAVATVAPALASTKSLSDYTCTSGSFQNGGHFIVGMTYDCLATASTTSAQPITISAVNNIGGIASATWLANLSSIGITVAFVNNGTTSAQVHITGTPNADVSSGSNYSMSFSLNDGTPPSLSIYQGFRSEMNFVSNATFAGTSGSTSLGSGPVVNSGSSVTLTATPPTLPAGYTLSYQWQKDGVNISGETSATLNIASITSSSAYSLNATPSWTDGVHTVTAQTPVSLGTYSITVRSGTTGGGGVTTTVPGTTGGGGVTTTVPGTTGGGGVTTTVPGTSATTFDESNTSISVLDDSATISGVAGTATFSDGSVLIVSKSGAVLPKLFTAFKGLVSGKLNATYTSGGKKKTFSCAFAKFGSTKAKPSLTKSVNNWFPKTFLPAKKACVLPKAAMTAAATTSVLVSVKLTFARLWPTTAKAVNPETKRAISSVKRTMKLTFGKLP